VKAGLANPVGAGLAHYTDSLEHVLRTCGIEISRIDVLEPSSAEYGRGRWLYSYFSGARRLVEQVRPDLLIAAWPAVGYWDLAVLTAIGRNRPMYLVVHDPDPLVYARGYGTVAKAVARRARSGAVVAHSPDAVRAISVGARMPRVLEALHPMLRPQTAPPLPGERPTVRVLGQFKVDRDVAGLERLASSAPPDWQLEIVGRGWPAIHGWRITSEFVVEDRFDELVRTSDVVLIPYSRFFQSGVAIRALEWGVPVVGPYASSLRTALGADCPWLVRDGDWLPAVAAAVGADRDEASIRARDLYDRVLGDWASLLGTMSERTAA
jgi:hypothetical protein